MIKKTLLTLVSAFFIWSVSAQQKKVIERDIDWQGIQTFKDKRKNQQTIFYLDFKNAAFLNQPSMWPWYHENLNVRSFNTKARIFDVQYKKVPAEWVSKINNADQLPDEISFDKVNVYGINNKPALNIFFLPLRYNKSANQFEMVTSFKVEVLTSPQLKGALKKSFQSASLLKSGSWRKIKVSETGVYRLSYDQILSMGYDNPENFRIFGFGGMLPQQNSEDFHEDLPEVPVFIKRGNDGVFNSGDYVFFFLEGPDDYSYSAAKKTFEVKQHLYSDYSFYFITCDKGTAQNLIEPKSQGALSPTDIVGSFDDFRHHEEDKVNLIRSGKKFFEPVDLYSSYSFAFNFPNLLHNESVKILAQVAGRSDEVSDFVFKSGGSSVLSLSTSAINLNGYTYATIQSGLDSFFISADQFNVDVSFPSTRPGAEGYLDYITLTARRDLKMDGYQMMFRDYHSVGPAEERTFRIENTSADHIVWNVTDPHKVTSMPVKQQNGKLLFDASTESLEEYVIFNSEVGITAPVYKDATGVGAVDNQDIHGYGPVDYVIVTHSKFLSQAERLADLHRAEGLSVLVVENEQVYNEFSSGTPDITAIKNMMRMFYSKYTSADERPRYLLLFGNGSYNNKDQFKENSNYILTYQSNNSVIKTSSFVSDDYYGLLDDSEGGSSGFVDIGIGRFPVETVSQAKVLVDKVETYMSDEAMGDWRNIVSFIGDDEDGNQHMDQANELSDTVTKRAPAFNIEKIFLDAYKQASTPSGQKYPDVEDAINNRFDKGALIINFTGHGGENGLTHERVIDISSIKSWNNHPRYPMLITASCEFSRYDDYKRTTAGEFTILNDKGGVIALLTTTRLVYSSPNFVLNLEFFRHVFERDSLGNVLRMGDVMARTKQNVASSTNKRNFSLLGDPALQIAIPDEEIRTTELNGHDVTVYTDTLKALSKVHVKGVLKDNNGQQLSDFDGLVYPVVYDKERDVTTLSNDGDAPFKYKVRNSVLYKGKASVSDGEFSFSFIVPKDIAYYFDKGKISYYAMDGSRDYHGYFKDFYIGGTADSVIQDDEGPDIELFLNDESFVPGSITDQNPVLLAHLSDSSGINTMGNGIGHDVTLVLDDKLNERLVLNDYYETDVDSYQEGKVNYQLSKLEDGTHKIRLKAWDVNNNSSEQTIDFIVASADNLKLEHVFNYPNPFTTYTEFHFDHNMANQELDVLIQIYTISGKLVKTLKQTIFPVGFRSNDITWDGLDDFGDPIGRGVYVYHLKVRTPEGKTAEKIEKLVILR